MKQYYKVRNEFADRWFGREMQSLVDMDEIERLAVEWETTVDALMEQVMETDDIGLAAFADEFAEEAERL